MGDPYAVPPAEVAVDPWTGVWIAEDIALIRRGIENGDWIDGTLGVVGTSLDGFALVSDPLGVLGQYGVSWIIEQVQPLTEALDWLAGDAAQIAAHAQTWRNMSSGLIEQADESERALRFDLSDWVGAAADEYRDWSRRQQQAIRALAESAATMAAITEGAGFLVAGVRELVRDAIATVVSRLVVYAIEEVATAGAATPLILPKVVSTVSSWAARIGRWLTGLLRSLDNLVPLVRRVEDHIDALRRMLERLGRAETEFPALHRVKKRGAGAIQLYDMESVRTIADRYGIDISGLRISLADRRHRGYCGRTSPDGSITLFVPGFRSEEDLARTLVHEKFHQEELTSGKPFPRDDEEFDAFEDRAYAHEDQWWKNQPVRPEPRRR